MSDEALDLLLSGVKDKDQRTEITTAYYSFGSGDPNTFPVRFALILKAHAAGLKLLPTRLQRALSTEIKPIRDALAAHQTFLEKTMVSPAERNGAGDMAEAIRTLQASLQQQLTAEIELLRTERDTVLSSIAKIQRLLKQLAAHRIVAGLLLSYVAGLLTEPLVQFFINWLLVRHN